MAEPACVPYISILLTLFFIFQLHILSFLEISIPFERLVLGYVYLNRNLALLVMSYSIRADVKKILLHLSRNSCKLFFFVFFLSLDISL